MVQQFSHTTGPQIDRILQKSLTVFPRLESTAMANMVTFYNCLQEVSMNHLLALIPFDAIMLQYCFEGLCPPGLGLAKYSPMSKDFIELLPWMIPGSTSSQIITILALVQYESGNGYNYLWRVMELTIPSFDPVVPIQVPVWTGANNIFSFAHEYLLFFHLQEKLNFHFDDQNGSCIFLRAIQFSKLADTVTVLQTQMNSSNLSMATATCLPTFVSMALLQASTRIDKPALRTLPHLTLTRLTVTPC